MYVKEERVKEMIEEAIRKHNRNASLISAALGIFILGCFLDGFLRVIGKIAPFLGIDISVLS